MESEDFEVPGVQSYTGTLRSSLLINCVHTISCRLALLILFFYSFIHVSDSNPEDPFRELIATNRYHFLSMIFMFTDQDAYHSIKTEPLRHLSNGFTQTSTEIQNSSVK